MSLRIPLLIASRELRGGLKSFRILVACLALGVASITLVGLVQYSIENGLSVEGAKILGGDVELEFAYRYADAEELNWIESKAIQVSEVVEFRSLAVVDAGGDLDKALTQVKGVDDHYPVYGDVVTEPPMPLDVALDALGGVYGALMPQTLADRLNLSIGDQFRLGFNTFELRAVLVNEPDNTGGGFTLGPRTLVRLESLEGSGLLDQGTLFSSYYRLQTDENTDLVALRTEAENALDQGFAWRDRRNGSPGIQTMVKRVGAFLTLVGLAGLVVGGIGISLAVSTYLETKTQTIATLKTLGANQGQVFLSYLFQILCMIGLGVLTGLALGTLLPLLLANLISQNLPVPFIFEVNGWILAECALYGLLIGLIFSFWSLSQTDGVKPVSLYRETADGTSRLPKASYLVSIGIMTILLVGTAALTSGITLVTLYVAGGVVATLIILGLASQLSRLTAHYLGHSRVLRGLISLSLAFRSIGGKSKGVISLTMALGLGLSVLATVGQISSNLLRTLSSNIPDIAPSYFVVDIQNQDIAEFTSQVNRYPGVSEMQSAPMLRGIITEINGLPARTVAGDHWVLRGDRGITYSAAPPEDTQITEGSWWSEDYDGPPLISFAEEEGAELGLQIGDMLTLNVLGRNLEAEIVNFRSVDFSTVGIGFILSLNPKAVQNAPHTHIATIYSDPETEEVLFDDLTSKYPNITMISVSEGIANVARILSGLGEAIIYASGVTLLVGFVVLIGASASTVSAYSYEAAILKVLGSTRRLLMSTFAFRSIILGTSAGLVAILAGMIGGWVVMTFVLEAAYRFEPLSAILIVLSGALFSSVSGLLYLAKLLNAKPSTILNNQG